MNKTSLLYEIKSELENLLRQTQKMAQDPHPVHPLDKDLMLEKTRRLYEKMMALERAGQDENNPVSKKELPTPEKEVTLPEEAEKTENPLREPQTGKENIRQAGISNPTPENQQTSPKQETHPENNNIETVTAKASPAPVAPQAAAPQAAKPQAAKPQAAKPQAAKPQAEKQETENPSKPTGPPAETTLDLFSSAPHESLGETLKPTEKPALADTLQTTPINDIREAIGINDKFTFVNDLFNGDLERYNKVMDELNGFTGLSGAQTYLAELQVQYQWNEESPAYRKLSLLLERKFS